MKLPTDEQASVFTALRSCRNSFVAAGVFSGAANLLMLVPAFYMLNVYDKAVGNNSTSTLISLSLITMAMFLALAAMEILRGRLLIMVSRRLDDSLSDGLLKRTFSNALAVGGQRATGQPLQDLAELRQFLTSQAVTALFDAPWVPIYLVVLFLFHPLVGWLGVFAIILLSLLGFLNQRYTAGANAKANDLHRRNSQSLNRSLQNVEVAASMGIVSKIHRQWRKQQKAVLDLQETAGATASSMTAVIKTLRLAIQSAAIGLGGYLVLAQEISPGMIIAGSILIGRALQPVEIAVSSWKTILNAKEHYFRLNTVLEKISLPGEKMRLPDVVGTVTAENVSVCAPGTTRPLISNLTFMLPAGSTLVLLGPSGAGKSTFVRAVLGLWPTLGKLCIDGAEASSYDRDILGPQLGYLPQNIELLDGPVNANIARMAAIDADAVVRAAQDAGVHEFILSLPEGYDTVVGTNGINLSPGQAQRIALARAIYGRPRLVVLDEPNSNLDEVGEAALNKAIRVLSENGSTVIVVSHRRGVIDQANVLMIMRAGRMVDFGDKEAVLARLAERSTVAQPPTRDTDSQRISASPRARPNTASSHKAELPHTVTWPVASESKD